MFLIMQCIFVNASSTKNGENIEKINEKEFYLLTYICGFL